MMTYDKLLIELSGNFLGAHLPPDWREKSSEDLDLWIRANNFAPYENWDSEALIKTIVDLTDQVWAIIQNWGRY